MSLEAMVVGFGIVARRARLVHWVVSVTTAVQAPGRQPERPA
jgi:hypothetical protein